MPLECGRSFGPITLAYETYGELSPAKDNAILILHALSGDAHAAGFNHPHERQPGWWDIMIGPGKAFDTRKYFRDLLQRHRGLQRLDGPQLD